MAITLKYGPVHSMTLETGSNIADLIDTAQAAWGIEGEVSAHCQTGAVLEDDYVPEEGAIIILRNAEPTKKGDVA